LHVLFLNRPSKSLAYCQDAKSFVYVFVSGMDKVELRIIAET
jgi:hypothetical protein